VIPERRCLQLSTCLESRRLSWSGRHPREDLVTTRPVVVHDSLFAKQGVKCDLLRMVLLCGPIGIADHGNIILATVMQVRASLWPIGDATRVAIRAISEHSRRDETRSTLPHRGAVHGALGFVSKLDRRPNVWKESEAKNFLQRRMYVLRLYCTYLCTVRRLRRQSQFNLIDVARALTPIGRLASRASQSRMDLFTL
jgi:hypothetical protein